MRKTIYNSRYRNLVCELKAARIRRGLGQVQVGRLLGRSRSWAGKVERVEVRLDVVQLIDVCRVLGVDAGRLVRRLAKEAPSDEDGSSFTYQTARTHLSGARNATDILLSFSLA